MPVYQDLPARQTSGSDEHAQSAKLRSHLRLDCRYPSITPSLDFDLPPADLKPLPVLGGRISGVPAFFSDRKACLATFGRFVKWTICDRSTFDHIAMACHNDGQPRCLDTYTYIAKATGHSRRHVIASIAKLESLRIIRADPAMVDGKPGRVIWLKTALRDDLPQLSGINRDDPNCTEPHHPAYGIFADFDPDGVNASTALPKGARAPKGTDFPHRENPHKKGARAPFGSAVLAFTPESGNGIPFAQPGSVSVPAPDRPSETHPSRGECERKLAPGGAYVYVDSSSPKEITYTYGPGQPSEATPPATEPAPPPANPIRAYRAGLLINHMKSKNFSMWSSYEADGEKIRTYAPAGSIAISTEDAAAIRELREEILAELRRMGMVAPPRGISIPNLPPTVERPASSAPARGPAASSTPGVAEIRNIYACNNLDSLEETTAMLITITSDDRAASGHKWSLNTQRKYARKLLAGELPLADFEEALEKAASPGAKAPVRVYLDHLKKAEAAPGKTGRPGVSAKPPGRPAAMPTNPG